MVSRVRQKASKMSFLFRGGGEGRRGRVGGGGGGCGAADVITCGWVMTAFRHGLNVFQSDR